MVSEDWKVTRVESLRDYVGVYDNFGMIDRSLAKFQIDMIVVSLILGRQ